LRKTKSTNPELTGLISFLKKQSVEKEVGIWRDVAGYLAKSNKRRTAVNLSRISRYTQKNETVIVPGKVLGTGTIGHPLTVAAFAFSEKAKAKLKAAKAKHLSLQELVEKNPRGTNVKIIR
jgi:large subunit ribosomal protein L18e